MMDLTGLFGPTGLCWGSVVCVGSHWSVLGISGSCWVSLDYVGSHWPVVKSTGLCWVWLSPCWVSLICVGFDCFHAGLNGPHWDSLVSGTPWVSPVSILGLAGLFVGPCWFVWGFTGSYTASHWFCEVSPDSVLSLNVSMLCITVLLVCSQLSLLGLNGLCCGYN